MTGLPASSPYDRVPGLPYNPSRPSTPTYPFTQYRPGGLNFTDGGTPPGPPLIFGRILQEDGFFLLQEDGSHLLYVEYADA